jgi:hypothetical protein
MTLRAQNELLRAALEWYADPETHRARDENGKCVWPILHDGGKRAREALGIPEPVDPIRELLANMGATE